MRFRYQFLRILFLIAAMLLLLWSVLEGGRATGRTLTRLVEVGWDLYVGRGSSAPVVFFFLCLGNDTCGDAFMTVWLQEYPLLLPFLAVASVWAGAVFSVMAQKQVGEKSPGGASWAAPGDLKLYLKGERNSAQRGYLGLLPNGKMLRIPERLRCAHTLVVGATGARKSTSYHKPNLVMDARDGVSVIVIDLKYPDTRSGFFDMVPLFVHSHDVQLFLPYGEHTLCFPLLAGTDTEEGASEIADMIAPDTEVADVDFYRGEERRLVTGLLMGLARDDRSSLGELYRLLKRGRSAVQSYVHKHGDAEVRENLSGFFDFNLQIQGNLIGGLAGKLQAFSDPRLDKATTASANPRENIDLEGIGLRPTLLYIGIPQEHLQGTRAKTLLKLIKRAIDLALLKTANAHSGRLPNHVSFYLDEFANLGVLPNVAENFATMRSRRVAYHVSLQNRAQGEALYGKEQFRSFFTNNFQQVVLFPRSLKFEDAEYFSKAMGMKAVLDKTKGTSREGFFSTRRRSETIRQVAEPLLSLEAMMTWPEEVGVLLASGSLPAKVLLPRLDEPKVLGTKNPLYRAFKQVVDAPKPSLLAEILINQRAGEGSSSQRSEIASAEAHPPLTPKKLGPPEPDKVTRLLPEEVLSEETVIKNESSNPQQALLDWLDTLLPHSVTVKVHTNPKTKQLSKLSLSKVPSSLNRSETLETWKEKGWIKVSSQEIGLVGEGLRLVGEKRMKKLKALADIQATGVSSTDTITQPFLHPNDAQKLRRYIQTVGHLLQGHPAREDDSNPPDAVGLYRPCTLLLEKALADSLSGSLSKRFTVRKEGASGDQRWVVAVPFDQLANHPKLKAWCEANWHRFKGHPAFQVQPTPQDMGTLLPEFVALPKRIVIDLFGAIPEQSQLTRPHLAGKRPVLVAFDLPLTP